MTKTEMLNFYNRLSAAQGYIIGFVFAHRLYMTRTEHISEDMLTLTQASRGQGDQLRLYIKASIRKALAETAICLGEDTLLLDSKYNKGETFERIVTEYYGQEWHKDTIPFYKQGDINIEGMEIQIKLNTASLINEKMLNKLMAENISA